MKQVNLIGINGKINAGKDTVGKIIQDLCSAEGYNFEIKKFAGKLKVIASLLTGIPIEKFEDQDFKKKALGREWCYPTEWQGREHWVEMTSREFLQKLGTDAMRDELHENVWVNALFADFVDKGRFINEEAISSNGGYYDKKVWEQNLPNWIITDMRFPNEMEAIQKRGGITIRVVRPETVKGTHPSETALDNQIFDYEIINDGSLEELTNKVKNILKKEKIIETND